MSTVYLTRMFKELWVSAW